MSKLEQFRKINDDARLGFITCAEAFYAAKRIMRFKMSKFHWEVFCDKYRLDHIAAGVCKCYDNYRRTN